MEPSKVKELVIEIVVEKISMLIPTHPSSRNRPFINQIKEEVIITIINNYNIVDSMC